MRALERLAALRVTVPDRLCRLLAAAMPLHLLEAAVFQASATAYRRTIRRMSPEQMHALRVFDVVSRLKDLRFGISLPEEVVAEGRRGGKSWAALLAVTPEEDRAAVRRRLVAMDAAHREGLGFSDDDGPEDPAA